MKNADSAQQRFWLAGKHGPAQYLVFKESLDQSRWQPGTSESWDTCWHTGMPKADVFEQLTASKTINHIPGINSLAVKSSLHATLAAARERMVEQEGEASDGARRWRFFPRVFSMPEQYHALQEVAAANPDQHWILKPKNLSRGRGIQVVRDIATVPLERNWMVQEYLDNPHTINGHKYVLRLYVLITSIEPLRVYLYNEGSAKLASGIYDLEDLDNPYAHLTNPDLNATNHETDSPVVFHSLGKYRGWLRESCHDDEALFARIRDMVTLTVIAAREKLRSRCNNVNADTSGCYELLGFDCLVDSDLKPWLLECNLSPSLDVCAAPKDGGDIEARNKRQLVVDLVQLLGLNEPSIDRSGLHPADRIRIEAETELARAGGFTRIYPASDVARYLPYFPLPRLADMVLADAIAKTAIARPTVTARHTAELIMDDRLSLYAESTGTLYTPNSSAAWIWLKAGDGETPDAIADQLLSYQPEIAANSAEEWRFRQEIWDVLADWAASGLLHQRLDSRPASSAQPFDPVERILPAAQYAVEADGIELQVGAAALRFWSGHQPVAGRLQSILSPLGSSHADGERLEVLQSANGYAIAAGSRLVADGLLLAQLGPVICRLLQERSIRGKHTCVIAGVLLPLENTRDRTDNEPIPAAFLPHRADGSWDLPALCLAERIGYGHAGGIQLALGVNEEVQPVGLPARIAEDDAELLTALTHIGPIGEALNQLHLWASGERGYLIPATCPLRSQPYQVTTIIVPSPDAGKPLVKQIPAQEVLAAMLPSAAGPAGVNLPTDAVQELAGWIAERRLLSLDVSNLQASIEALIVDAMVNPGVRDREAS